MSVNNKLIFLDIDGVLNSHQHCKEHPEVGIDLDNPHSQVLFKYLRDNPGVDVCISSTWRKFSSHMFYLKDLFKRNGCGRRIIGKTPVLERGATRGEEIKSWMDSNPINHRYQYQYYCVLDDELDIKPHNYRFVYVNARFGLAEQHLPLIDMSLKYSL